MLRFLGVALVAAAVLASASAAAERLSKDEYVSRVREIGTAVDRRAPLEELQEPADPAGWLSVERRFRAEMLAAIGRLAELRPPAEVERLHRRRVKVLRRCVDDVHALVAELPSDASPDAYRPPSLRRFQLKVQRTLDACCKRTCAICREFEKRGYVF